MKCALWGAAATIVAICIAGSTVTPNQLWRTAPSTQPSPVLLSARRRVHLVPNKQGQPTLKVVPDFQVPFPPAAVRRTTRPRTLLLPLGVVAIVTSVFLLAMQRWPSRKSVSSAGSLSAPYPEPSTTLALLAVSGEPTPGFRAEPSLPDLLAFGGLLPETINGRCAQLAFVAGLAAELSTGQTMPQQLEEYPLAPAVAIALVILASAMPRLRDATGSVDPASRSRPGSTFSARHELVNGRTAMIGVLAAVAQEWATGQPLLG
jgi:hypothetical protein